MNAADGFVADHGRLGDLVTTIRQDTAAGVDWAVLAVKLDQVVRIVEEHFAAEERAMERLAYPKIDQHMVAHQTFLRRLKVARAECDRRESELMGLFTELLEHWFKNHERTADDELLAFLRSRKA